MPRTGSPLRRGLSIALFLLPLLGSAVSSAREPTPAELSQARDLFAKAERDERAGDWKNALEKLERAGAVKMTPGIRFHIALAQENLGMSVEALASYEAAAQQARADNVKDVLESIQEPLAELRARVPSLTLSLVNVSADDVEVAIDDRAIASSDLGAPLRLAPGNHRIVAKRKSDGQSFTKDLALRERDTMALDLRLPAGAERATGAPAPAPFVPPPETAPAAGSRVPAIIATGGAVIFLAGGIGAFLAAGSAQDDLKACASKSACSDVQSEVRTWDAIALGSFVGAAAVGAVATVLWLSPSEPPRTKAASLSVTAGARGLWLRGAF